MRLETFTHKTINEKQHDALVSLSRYASTLNDPAAKNYSVDDWQESPDTLLYAFYKKKRFDIFNSAIICFVYCTVFGSSCQVRFRYIFFGPPPR